MRYGPGDAMTTMDLSLDEIRERADAPRQPIDWSALLLRMFVFLPYMVGRGVAHLRRGARLWSAAYAMGMTQVMAEPAADRPRPATGVPVRPGDLDGRTTPVRRGPTVVIPDPATTQQG